MELVYFNHKKNISIIYKVATRLWLMQSAERVVEVKQFVAINFLRYGTWRKRVA